MPSAYTRIKILPSRAPDDSLAVAKIVAFYGFWQCQVTLHEVEAEIAALVECWQGRTIAVMLRHTKAGVTGVRMRCARFRKGKYTI
jgi:hypothetical protein